MRRDEVMWLRESIATLESQLDQANGRALILQAQLGGWEGAYAAQMLAARGYIDALANRAHTDAQTRAELTKARADVAALRSALEVLLGGPTDAAQTRARAALATLKAEEL